MPSPAIVTWPDSLDRIVTFAVDRRKNVRRGDDRARGLHHVGAESKNNPVPASMCSASLFRLVEHGRLRAGHRSRGGGAA